MTRGIRFFIILIAAVFALWNVLEKDWVGAAMMGIVFMMNLVFHAVEDIKEHIDKKLNQEE